LEANVTAAYFEDHPTDPDKVILRKPRLDQGPDYERGFIDGMMYQTQTSVYRAVDAMSKRTWVGLTDEEIWETISRIGTSDSDVNPYAKLADARAIEAKLRSKNNG
jgi:hypothetical protein